VSVTENTIGPVPVNVQSKIATVLDGFVTSKLVVACIDFKPVHVLAALFVHPVVEQPVLSPHFRARLLPTPKFVPKMVTTVAALIGTNVGVPVIVGNGTGIKYDKKFPLAARLLVKEAFCATNVPPDTKHDEDCATVYPHVTEVPDMAVRVEQVHSEFAPNLALEIVPTPPLPRKLIPPNVMKPAVPTTAVVPVIPVTVGCSVTLVSETPDKVVNVVASPET